MSAFLQFAKLSDPQDICLLPDNRVAIADQDCGVFIVDKSGHLLKSFDQLVGSASLCYSEVLNRLAVVRSNEDVDAEDSRYQICVIGSDLELETERIKIPNIPDVKEGYTRWIIAEPESGNFLVTTGDSSTAVIWMWNVKTCV
ncbi:unnamed protein product [Anisakis simplex]|uniref:WD_REPEATS_REGION domain-containing protein n=1 Tax=Anisakis simplex TaxID=6269 RepID=A0A0M3JB59_ANISI|nr:unnamed protein product [Anisakis simplex]